MHPDAHARYGRTVAAISLALLLGATAHAQDAAKPRKDVPKDEEKPLSEAAPAVAAEPSAAPVRMPTLYVVGSKEEARELGGSGTYIDTSEIRTQNYDDINRVLRRVPGVYVRPEDGYGLFPNISLRGADTTRSAKVTIMEDGVLSAPAPYSAPAAYYSPTTGRMTGIEVLKGSSQSRYGPHTTGGVINYISTPIPVEGPRFYAKTTYGSESEYRVHVHGGDVFDTDLGRVSVLLEYFERGADGFKTIDGTPDFDDRDDTGFTKKEPMLKAAWEPGTEMYQRLEFKYGHTDLDADEAYLGLSEEDFGDDPYRRYSSTRFDNLDSENERMHARYYIELNPDVDVTTTWHYANFERDWFKLNDVADASGTRLSLSRALARQSHLSVLKGEAAGTLRVRHNAREYWQHGVASVLNTRFDTGGASHTVTVGGRTHWDKVRRKQFDESYTQRADGTLGGVSINQPGDAGDRVQETTAYAVFLEDRIEVGRWTFVPGYRVEALRQTHIDYDDRSTDGRNSMTVKAGGLSAVYRIDEEWSAFGGLHTGFSVPSPRAAVKDDLDEETSLGYELGARYARRDGALSAEASGFLTYFDNLIVIDNQGGAGAGESENVGKVRSYGLETTVDYDAGFDNAWGFGNPWFLTATLTSAEVYSGDASSADAESIFSGAERGNDVPYIPSFSVSGGTGIEVEQFSAFATLTWVDDTYTTASNTSSQVAPDGTPDARFGKTDSYVVIDLTARYAVSEQVTFFAGVQNLTDREYLVSRHPHGPRPGAPRFLYGGFELEF